LVTGDGQIRLEVEFEIGDADGADSAIAGATVPGQTTQRIFTTGELKAGQALVMGRPSLWALLGDPEDAELIVLVSAHLVD
jgi:hypothetical protein